MAEYIIWVMRGKKFIGNYYNLIFPKNFTESNLSNSTNQILIQKL
jgi:hypothetical protein